MTHRRSLLPAMLVCLAASATAWPSVAQPRSEPAPPAVERDLVTLNALIRQARVAQRDCDIAAKRLAVSRIQRAMDGIALILERDYALIAADVRALRRDGVALADLDDAMSALEASAIAGLEAATASPPALKRRLERLHDRYANFDELETLHSAVVRVLSRLDAAPGDCTQAHAPDARRTEGRPCPADAFAPCRYGRPLAGAGADPRVVIPIEIIERR